MAKQLRVLIVDDEVVIAMLLKHGLPGTWMVQSESDSAKALSRLLREDFDVILLDLMIPHMSGMTLFGELAAKKPELCSRVIFITGGLYIPAIRVFLKALPHHIAIEKPFTVEEVVSAVLKITGIGSNGSNDP